MESESWDACSACESMDFDEFIAENQVHEAYLTLLGDLLGRTAYRHTKRLTLPEREEMADFVNRLRDLIVRCGAHVTTRRLRTMTLDLIDRTMMFWQESEPNHRAVERAVHLAMYAVETAHATAPWSDMPLTFRASVEEVGALLRAEALRGDSGGIAPRIALTLDAYDYTDAERTQILALSRQSRMRRRCLSIRRGKKTEAMLYFRRMWQEGIFGAEFATEAQLMEAAGDAAGEDWRAYKRYLWAADQSGKTYGAES